MTNDFQQPFITLVDQILAAKKQPPSSPFSKGEFLEDSPLDSLQGVCADTSALERQIDEMVRAGCPYTALHLMKLRLWRGKYNYAD